MRNSREVERDLGQRLEELAPVSDGRPQVSLEDLLAAMFADSECRRIAGEHPLGSEAAYHEVVAAIAARLGRTSRSEH